MTFSMTRTSGWFALITILSCASAQPPLVSEVSVSGHRITKQFIIEREIQHPVGIPLDSTLAHEDRDRIDNLGIFSEVQWKTSPTGDHSVRLEYFVIESWRYFPGILPTYEEDTGWSLNIGLLVNNFRGYNESLAVGGSIGGKTTYGVQFVNPWITGDHISLELGIGKSQVQHVYLPYEVITASFGANIGRYYGYHRKVQIGFELEEKRFVGDSRTVTFMYFGPQGSFEYDTRDIYIEPSKGMYIRQDIYGMADMLGRHHNRLKWTQSYSFFRTLIPGNKKLVLGMNVGGRTVFGYSEEVWMEYIGGGYSIRGWGIPDRNMYTGGNRNFRFGYHWMIGTVELRKTVIPRQASQFRNEYGLTVVLFVDGGVAGRSRSELLDQRPMISTGIGLQIPWPIIQIIRLDYGWAIRNGEVMESSFHLSFGQKF